MTTCFLLDEHLPKWWRADLAKYDPDLQLWRIGDPQAPPWGSPDPLLLQWCETYDFFLVTNNRKSMPVHLADHCARGRHVPGIFVVDPAINISDLATELILIAGASLENEFQDQIRFLPIP